MSVLVIEPEASDPIGPLGDWLTAAGLRAQHRRPQAGDTLPADSTNVEGLIVLGGSMGAGDDADYPYLRGIRRLLAEAVAREVPTLGSASAPSCWPSRPAARSAATRTGPSTARS